MSKEIVELEPKIVWKHFYALTQIPRPSKKEGKIIAYMKKFGEDLGLETIVDEVGNVIIRKPATPGMENRKAVVLQGHLDMVPQKNSNVEHDFENDPIDAYIDGEWVTARGTTLGADNGIGVSAAMAVLESKDLKHGPVEALFTIDEETGMTGAFGLKPGILSGEILINLDSEDEGELYIGCAGGTNANIRFEITREKTPLEVVAYKVSLTGLKGGHSGIDIHMGKGNANKLMNRLLWTAYRQVGMMLSTVEGGNLRNAIPREAFATVVVPESTAGRFEKLVTDMETILKNEYGSVEPGISLTAEKTKSPETVLDADSHYRLLNAVYACPNGVIRMSTDMEGLVETSTNLAVYKTGKADTEVLCLMRSSVDSAREDLKNMFRSVFEPSGAEVQFEGEYPGWKPNPDSLILKEMKEIYNNKFGKIPEIRAIHAGLECGLLGGAYPGLDMISFGPTIRFPHSPDEKVNIPTVQKFWDFLVETLEHIPEK
ncbi:MAG: aminoacyl-histidine dipeptidase [Chlorobi bacterium]|nr:aminoacyl-histidine dipeptidase [Chlorobiota bacterium]